MRLPEKRLENAAIKARIVTKSDPSSSIPFSEPERSEYMRGVLISALQRFPVDVQEEIHLQIATYQGNRWNPEPGAFPVDGVDRHVMLKNRIARSLLIKDPQDVTEIFKAAAVGGEKTKDKR